MPITIPAPSFYEVTESKGHYENYCWRLELRQTVGSYHWTEWSHSIELFDGQTYSPIHGADSSAKEELGAIEPGNKDIKGILAATVQIGLTGEDIRRGVLQDAVLHEYLVDVRQPWNGLIDYKIYHVSGATFDGSQWTCTLEGMSLPLHEQVGEYWGVQCRAKLFSTGLGKCNASVLDFVEPYLVDAIVNQGYEFEIAGVVAPWNVSGHATDGKVFFNGGFNVGGFSTIKNYTFLGGGQARIQLQRRTLRDFNVGDGITVYPGCNHSPEQCHDKFDNLVNFQGEPLIPGADRATRGFVD